MNPQLDSKHLGVVSPRRLHDEIGNEGGEKAINDGIRQYLYEIAAHENVGA